MLHSLIARRRVGPQTQWRPRHKAFTSGLGLDAMSLAWLIVVQLVVFFNSGLQWGIIQEYLSLFRHSDRFDFVFSLRCIDWVRKPLCEPNFFMYFFFVLRTISEPRVKFVRWKAFGTRKTGLSWPFQGSTSVVVPCCYLVLLSVFILWLSYYVSDIFCKF